ncbi:MAG: hypothetical protein H8M99_15685 [Gloeobacteraceae cyanobacterium ES-bin-144]|nr:hypothetical protein [Verrucomicrobiales bacterium]
MNGFRREVTFRVVYAGVIQHATFAPLGKYNMCFNNTVFAAAHENPEHATSFSKAVLAMSFSHKISRRKFTHTLHHPHCTVV